MSDPKLTRVGFAMSLIATVGLFMVSPFGWTVALIGTAMMLLAMPGLVVCVVSFRRQRSRLGGWGIALSIFVLLYYATIYGAAFRSFGAD
jgi:hypothetical protein